MTYPTETEREFTDEELAEIETQDFRVEGLNPETISRLDRLRDAVRQAGGNKTVAARSGVPASSLGAYMQGKRELRLTTAIRLARACGVTLEWLATGKEQLQGHEPATVEIRQEGQLVHRGRLHRLMPPISTLDQESDQQFDTLEVSFIPIPRYEVKASAGSGIEVVEQRRVGDVALKEDFLRRVIDRQHDHLVSIEASGDSMDPTIRDGDLLVVDTSVRVIESSRVYVLDVDGHLLVKRVQRRLDGSLLIKSDNPKYETETLHPSERNPLRVIGEVVYQAGPVRS